MAQEDTPQNTQGHPGDVAFDRLDRLTQRALVYWLAQDAPPDPEMDALVRQAQGPAADPATVLAAKHAIADLAEQRNPLADLETPARVGFELPGGLPLVMPDPGAPPEQQRRVRQWVLSRVVDALARRVATHDPEERRALGVVVAHPPPDQDAGRWTPARVRRFYSLWGLREAWAMATDTWEGRVGTQEGSETVDRPVVPAEAGLMGFWQWLRQEAPEYARRALLDRAAELTDPGRRDLRQEFERDWPADSALIEMAAAQPIDDDAVPDRTVLRLAAALLWWPNDTDRPRRLLMALWAPELAETMEEAAAVARGVLTPEDRRLLAVRCGSDRELAAATGIPEGQVPAYRAKLFAVMFPERRPPTIPSL